MTRNERSESKDWCIYTLSDPDTLAIRYVGLTRSHDQRLRFKEHVSDGRRGIGRSRKAQWIINLASAGKIPTVSVIHRGSGNGFREVEREWISHTLDTGADLLNVVNNKNYPRSKVVFTVIRIPEKLRDKAKVRAAMLRIPLHELITRAVLSLSGIASGVKSNGR